MSLVNFLTRSPSSNSNLSSLPNRPSRIIASYSARVSRFGGAWAGISAVDIEKPSSVKGQSGSLPDHVPVTRDHLADHPGGDVDLGPEVAGDRVGVILGDDQDEADPH